jgi:hypothetical protein
MLFGVDRAGREFEDVLVGSKEYHISDRVYFHAKVSRQLPSVKLKTFVPICMPQC